MHLVTQGIVLRETTYKEADKILTVLTAEGGRRTVKARGCRRKGSGLAAASQLLVFSDMTLFTYKEYYNLQEGESIRQFWNVRSSMEKLALASYFAQVTECVADEGVANPALLSLLLNCLHVMDSQNKPLALIKAVFELRCMVIAGYAPLFDGCAICGATPQAPSLHLQAGVVHCAACRGQVGPGVSLPLSPGVYQTLDYLLTCDAKRLFCFTLSEAEHAPLTTLTEAYLMTQLEGSFPTLDFYKAL